MSISKYIAPISDAVKLVKQLLIEEFSVNPEFAEELAYNNKGHFVNLLDTCYLLAETGYVDKVYRDSYYNYFSSKIVSYKKDCVRISLFDGEIKAEDFTNKNTLERIRKTYRGFLILRPTEPQIIGRSLISPLALKNKGFLSCTVKINSTVNSLKVTAEGFPHSSQDCETISCAETTLWAVMEYFGNKYPEYKPVLPSIIIKSLNRVSFERQIPSKGLNIQQMSFALKEFGFGTRIYSKDSYDKDFERLLSCYIESGIPIILGIDNTHVHGGIGHALLCVGRQKIGDAQIDGLTANQIENRELLEKVRRKKISIFDWDNLDKSFVFIDDNFPVYQQGNLNNPVEYYENPDWCDCTIKHFVVPLYPKIYLEAFEAKNYVYHFLASEFSPLETNDDVLIRFFLVSSRSFKHEISLYSDFEKTVLDMILETPMPKFIWIAELSTKAEIKKQKAFGLLILDATEANLNYNYPLLFAYYKDKVITPNYSDNTLEQKIISSKPFNIYENNLQKC